MRNIPKELSKVLNEQLNRELYSAYLYLSMAAYFDSVNLSGFAHWMKVQAKEELNHAMKFYSFLNDVGAKVVLGTIEKPPASFSSAEDVFKKALTHEQRITANINKLYALAEDIKENATIIFLQWFITEQVEEEKAIFTILEDLKRVKGNDAALIIFDRELGKRE